MKRGEIWQESIWQFECPRCHEICVLEEDPDYSESICCEHCGEEFQLEDDE